MLSSEIRPPARKMHWKSWSIKFNSYFFFVSAVRILKEAQLLLELEFYSRSIQRKMEKNENCSLENYLNFIVCVDRKEKCSQSFFK